MSKKEAMCRGTVAAVAGALAVNGGERALTQPELSMLMRAVPGIAKQVGTIRQPGKGRPAIVYDWFPSAVLKLSLAPGAKIGLIDEDKFEALQSPTGKGKLVENITADAAAEA